MRIVAVNIFLVILSAILLFSCENEKHKLTDSDYGKFKKPLEGANKILVEKDRIRIEKYCERRNWDMKETGTGLFYDIYFKGDGDTAKKGDIAKINATVSLLDGTQCYSSDSLGPNIFKIGRAEVESGLEEGILLMQVGDKAHFILPPYMAYGIIGDEYKIPPLSIIVYDVELLELSKE